MTTATKRRWSYSWAWCLVCLAISAIATFFTPAISRANWALIPVWEQVLKVVASVSLGAALVFALAQFVLVTRNAFRRP